jgi:hypothetical protein
MAMEADFRLAGVSIGKMQLDIVLPLQHFGSRRAQPPERRLMIAVLHDALECICGALDLDSNAVRQRLRVVP